jgi:hypothetical protein
MEGGGRRLIGLIILSMCAFLLRILVSYRRIKQNQSFTKENRMKRQKKQKMEEDIAFAETLYYSDAPADKIMGYLNDKSIYDNTIKQEKTNKREVGDSLVLHELTRGFYKIFTSNENSGHFFSLFTFVPEYLEYFSREFYMFRYFLVVFFSEFYIGKNHLSGQARVKFNDLIVKSGGSESACPQWHDESEFLLLALKREAQYRNNIPSNFDNANREAVSKFIAGVLSLFLKEEGIEETLFGEDFCINANDSLTKEYFGIREKIREHVQKTVRAFA